MQTDKIAILIKKAALEFDKIANPMLAEYDLTASQYRVLKYLVSLPDKTARIVDIEKECSITHPTALGLLDNLAKKGFVEKVVNPQDARSKVISLTDKTKNMQEELENAGNRLEDKLTENLTEKERQQLLSLLQKMLKTDQRK